MQEGLDTQHVLGTYGHATECNALVDQLTRDSPQEFTEAWIDANSGCNLRFTGRITVQAESIDFPVVLHENAGFSAQDLRLSKRALAESLLPQVSVATVGHPSGSNVITVATDRPLTAQARGDLVRSLTVRVSSVSDNSLPPALGVVFRETTSSATVESGYVRGGAALGLGSSGFVMVSMSNNAVKGLATAGHVFPSSFCPGTSATNQCNGLGTLRYSGLDGARGYVSPSWRHLGPSGDVGVGAVRELALSGSFFYNMDSSGRVYTRQVGAQGPIPSPGTPLSFFGAHSTRTEFATVREVVDVVRECAGGKCLMYDMVITNSDVTTGGDSGAPWFSGTTAYGIHSGDHPWSDKTGMGNIFTRIAAPQALGWKLWVP